MLLNLATRYCKLSAFLMLELFLFSITVSANPTIRYRDKDVPVYNAVNYAKKSSGNSLVREAMPDVSPQPAIDSFEKEKPVNFRRKQSPLKLSIGGPGQPEMSAFKPVGSDNMVDPFTGDFSYNIPLLDVGGYPVNIFYNSGITMDQEASWCGLGWNINPGTIMRNMRGLPDDFDGTKGDVITKTQYTKPEKTYGVSVGGSAEIFGGPIKLGFDAGIFYNNMRGIGLEAGINPTLGISSNNGDGKTSGLNFGWSLKANSQTGGSQTFSISLESKNKEANTGSKFGASLGMNSRSGLSSLHLSAEYSKDFINDKSQRASIKNGDFGINPTMGTTISFAYPAITPSITSRLRNRNVNIDLGFGVAGWGAYGHMRLGGYYTETKIRDEDIKIIQPAYGMLYMQQGNKEKNALLDFNRLNDAVYTPNAPTIAIPAYTYDIFSINGEGTGGSFRAYRGDLGFVNDPYTENTSEADALGIELGAGTYGHGAVNVNIVQTPSHAGKWGAGNLAVNTMAFRNSDSNYQSSYFKNPGEKAIPDPGYQNAIGGEDLVRLKMTNTNNGGNPLLVPALMKYTDTRQYKSGQDVLLNESNTLKKRDKRTQVISFLTAEEADKVGLNRKITSIRYPYDSINTVMGCASVLTVDSSLRFNNPSLTYRKSHQISEIDVLTNDGRKYVYGTPVYNTKQVDVTFNKTGDAATQMSSYTPGIDNVEKQNNNGKNGFVEKQEMPAYTHSFLLTGLLSPNYVDVTGNGITDDDMGDAVKFNYSLLPDKLGWRTPVGPNSATFNEGLRTDKNDDKSHYIYGARESWYLYNIESKNMVARFYIKNDRQDSKSVNEDGSVNSNFGAQRLSKISLFTKADLIKYGGAAKPVKTVNFTYDYSLCPGTPGSLNGAGKLTLRSIYFTYNGNEKQKKNYYRFSYPADKNPAYKFTDLDRWGNYKPAVSNPQGIKNADFPYVNTNKALTDSYAAAWTLNKISLPSGSTINVNYESDDYAFVQDRRASDMFAITGFGNTPNPGGSLSSNQLYIDKSTDNDYIYVTVPQPITATSPGEIKKQIEALYLGNIAKSKQLFMKLSVQILRNQTGSELIPIYADIDDYGLLPNTGGSGIYIKVKKLESNYTPMVQNSLQFMKNFLPGKAYPGNDVSDDPALRQVVKALGGLYHSFKENFSKGFALFKEEGKCKFVDNALSFVRLTDPNLQKPGGGIRVKKIVIDDNFDKMTKSNPTANDGMIKATYGQEYFYTKQELVNNQLKTISSGVASWEPGIGGEENPHREILSYFNKNKKGPFDFSSVELPLAEMFFPSASVGYSRVEVRSIHRDTVKNAAGIQVSEFFTTREFPTKVGYTPLDDNNATDKYDPSPLMRFLKIDINKAVSLSQGFKAELNDMNGKMRKQATYSPNNLISPISYSENFYNISSSGNNLYKFNHNFPVMENASGAITQNMTMGREVELMTDFREHKMETFTTNLNFNLDVVAGFFIPIPVPTSFTPTVYESDTYRSSSVLKVVNHYGMIDSVVAFDKGSMVSTKNLVYDAETGEPLVTRTNNEFNRPVYNFSYPAHWAYTGMSPAYKNIDVTYSGVTFRNGRIMTAAVNKNLFESGDEIYVKAENNTGVAGTQPCDAGVLAKNTARKIWAVNTGKAGSATPEMLFIDADGNPFTAANAYIRVIRSGKRNMAGVSLGSITSLNSPLNVAGTAISLSDATGIVQASGAAFKDHWRVDNSLFKFDSTGTITAYARIKAATYNAANTANCMAPVDNGTVYGQYNDQYFEVQNNRPFLSIRNVSYDRPYTWAYETWIDFNMKNNLPGGLLNTGAVIIKSKLSLSSHTAANVINNNSGGYTHPYTSYGANHGSNWSHFNNDNPQNAVSILAMKAAWPTSTTGWYHLFNDAGRNLHNWNNIGYINPTSFQSSVNYNSGDNRITIPNAAINELLANARNSNSNFATGFRLMQSRSAPGDEKVRRKHDVSQCFMGIMCQASTYNNFSNQPNGNSASIPPLCTSPALTIMYYNCGDTDYSSVTDTDPLVNTIIACGQMLHLFTECRSKFTQRKSINPYVEGVWGNWRVDTTYTYYGDRKESNAADPAIDLRTAGTITGFKPFWAFNSAGLQRNYAASDVWSWTSSITQYNRKGYDIENKDPLGRYNAGLYGYNQQLPVAVINNSHNAESMFDGFEDYDYQSNTCAEFCKAKRRADFGNISGFIDATQSHSGKNSLRVNAGSSVMLTAPVISTNVLERGYSMRVKIDSIAQSITTSLTPTGTGLKASYKNHSAGSLPPLEPAAPYDFINNSGSSLNLTQGSLSPVPNTINTDLWSVKLEGKLQPLVSGTYRFYVAGYGRVRMKINGNDITGPSLWNWPSSPLPNNRVFSGYSSAVYMAAGSSNTIEVSFYDRVGSSNLNIAWEINGSLQALPQNVLYLPSSPVATLHSDTAWCTKPDSIQVRGNALTDTFTLLQNKKMLLSAWVKEGGTDCKACTYTKNSIVITFNNGALTLPPMQSVGSVIEGWQRYEGEFTVPVNAENIKVALKNNGGYPVWFDDVRIHPYNANMKSFVYHPSNLKLMAELDENNYASFYEYDDDGTLTRVKKETIKGIKTITETRSALQKAVTE